MVREGRPRSVVTNPSGAERRRYTGAQRSRSLSSECRAEQRAGGERSNTHRARRGDATQGRSEAVRDDFLTCSLFPCGHLRRGHTRGSLPVHCRRYELCAGNRCWEMRSAAGRTFDEPGRRRILNPCWAFCGNIPIYSWTSSSGAAIIFRGHCGRFRVGRHADTSEGIGRVSDSNRYVTVFQTLPRIDAPRLTGRPFQRFEPTV